MPCQTFEASFFLENISISHLPLQYLARTTLDQRLSFSFINRQPSLVRKAAFACLIDLKPRPPASLGLVTFSQEILWIFFCSEFPPHKNFLAFLSQSSQSDLGSFALCIA
uniref:Uncharacterized protein n=1 Tax=Opuntia streptacantha TaxID=393608 RepID=A0A7C8Z2M6_OPUST